MHRGSKPQKPGSTNFRTVAPKGSFDFEPVLQTRTVQGQDNRTTPTSVLFVVVVAQEENRGGSVGSLGAPLPEGVMMESCFLCMVFPWSLG